ncbi:MAG TPA: bacillithiol transferase BstA [Terriglobales bacterium]|nr:bacillithiol transferase BstA [Terriglobales bacterium]
MTDPRYPIGKFSFEGSLTDQQKSEFLNDIEQTPARMRAAVEGLCDKQLDTPYREDGWTLRQVVHHVPDSHMNAYVRFKLALTEEEPTIRPYMEALWAELPEAKSGPVDLSLTLLELLHQRWTMALRGMMPAQWKRTLRHPEIGVLSLEKMLALYAWHGRHHVAHITGLRERMGW